MLSQTIFAALIKSLYKVNLIVLIGIPLKMFQAIGLSFPSYWSQDVVVVVLVVSLS